MIVSTSVSERDHAKDVGAESGGVRDVAQNNTINVDETSAEFKAHVMERVEDSYNLKNRVSIDDAFAYIRERRRLKHV